MYKDTKSFIYHKRRYFYQSFQRIDYLILIKIIGKRVEKETDLILISATVGSAVALQVLKLVPYRL